LFLYYITDSMQLASEGKERTRLLLQRIQAAANAGVDAIQLREKHLSAPELSELAVRVIEIIKGANGASKSKTRLLINSRVDVALACGADGVHLRSNDISAADARAVFMQVGVTRPTIAVSCHTLQEVELAEGHGADFAVFGPAFDKSSTHIAPTGIAELKLVCQRLRAAKSPMPVLALGGVDLSNAAECLEAGAAGIAGIRLFQSGDLKETVSRLRELADSS
jgi:thiamine-phosphate pyrophosphorylase